jgi:HEAT repeats
MRRMVRQANATAISLLWVLLSSGGPALARKYTVCTLTITTHDEIDEFRKHLDPNDFDFVELTPADHQAFRMKPWFENACQSGVQCDVVVISSEFAGSYFETGGLNLPLQEMEEQSCGAGCDGIFRRPLEVFLFACNSLASKGPDQRTPEEYLRVLLDHGFSRAQAERVVAARYGNLGSSFCETTRRVFAGVPLIYGFDSQAPSGRNARPLVAAYLRAVGDYAAHLRALETARADPTSQPHNAVIGRVFAHTSFRQTTGAKPDEAAFRKRVVACALYDERRSIAERLEIIGDVMAGPDFLAFLPNVQAFFARHPPSQLAGTPRETFATLTGIANAREQILALMNEQSSSLLSLELAQFARQMSWIDAATFDQMARSGVRHLLEGQTIGFEEREIICEIAKLDDLSHSFTEDDLPPGAYRDPNGIMAIDCLGMRGSKIIDGLTGALDNPDAFTREWAVYALSRQAVADPPHVAALARRLHDADPKVRALAGQTLRYLHPQREDSIEAIRRVAPDFDVDWLPAPKHGWFGG